MSTVYISLGSNSADAQEQMQSAMQFVSGILADIRCSSVYRTRAANGRDADYLNAVVCGESGLPGQRMTSIFKEWEHKCGRTPQSKLQGVIPIDLDVVIYDGEILRRKDFDAPWFATGYTELTEPGA